MRHVFPDAGGAATSTLSHALLQCGVGQLAERKIVGGTERAGQRRGEDLVDGAVRRDRRAVAHQ